MNFIRTWGWAIGLLATVIAIGVYVYSVRTLTSLATDVLSPASSRSETALTIDTKIYALARKTREQRVAIREFFIKKSTLVHVFDYIEQIRKRTGTAIRVLGISESAPQPRKRSRKSSDEDEEQTTTTTEEAALPQPRGLASVSVSLEIRGEKTSLIDTIRLLEMLPAVSNLQSVSIRTRDSGNQGAEEWVGNVTLFLPTLPDEVVEEEET